MPEPEQAVKPATSQSAGPAQSGPVDFSAFGEKPKDGSTPSTPQASPQGAVDMSAFGEKPKGQEQAAPEAQGTPEEKPSGMEAVSGFEAGATPETGYHPGPLNKGVTGGMGAEALDMLKGLPKMTLGVPGLAYEHLKYVPSQYRAYEAARQKGLSPVESMKVVQQEIQKKGNAYTQLVQRVKDLRSADSETSARAIGKTIMDLVPIALGLAEGVAPAAEEAAIPAAAEATAPIAAEAAPIEAAAARTAQQVTHRYNPATKSVEPIQQAVAKGAGQVAEKVGLPEGTAATVAPSGEAIQPAIEHGLNEVSEMAAKDAGVPFAKGADVRDSIGATARATKASASADYKALDNASEGRWQRFDDSIENINKEIAEKVGIDDEKVTRLEARRDDILASQENMLKDMVSEGKVDPSIADRARAAYKKSMALHDVNAAVRGATKRTVVAGKSANVTDPDGLLNRLNKLNDVPPSGGPSRLQQALGEKGAKTAIEHAENAQIAKAAIKEFTPTSSTGKVALEDILRKHTTAKPGIVTGAKGKVDWKAAMNDFEQLEPAERNAMFGNDVPALRSMLARNARIQTAKEWILKYGGYAAAGAAGADILRMTF